MSERRLKAIADWKRHIAACKLEGIYEKHPHAAAADKERLDAIERGDVYFDYDAQEWIDEEV